MEPPNCPACGKPLNEVHWNDYQIWSFNRETGRYDEKESTEADQKCPKCGYDFLGEEPIPEGPANYSTDAE